MDGPIHNYQQHADQERQAILEMLGLNILRLKTELVEEDINAALELIRARINELKSKFSNSPSPDLWEGKGGGN